MIVPTLARLIIREHLYKPIHGKVLTLGRQTIAMTYEQVIEMLQQEGYTPSQQVLSEIVITQDQKTRVGKGTDFITDEVFFRLFGVKELLALDVSEYEGCDIVHDLNRPIPESLCGQFDFIIDGGTFDHLFDIRTAFENVVKLLRAGGRILQWNAASNFTGAAYLSFGPDLFFDYYVANQFADCKVYVAELDSISQSELWEFYEFEGHDQYSHLRSGRIQVVVVLAEKGPSSTWDRMPVQAQYRDAHLWGPYRTGKKLIQESGRKPLMGHGGLALPDTQRDSHGLKQMLLHLRGRIPGKWKGRIPMKLKTKVNALLQEKGTQEKRITGFRYVGRI
jgi:SAM-dependent methyltransferase